MDYAPLVLTSALFKPFDVKLVALTFDDAFGFEPSFGWFEWEDDAALDCNESSFTIPYTVI